MTQATHGEPGVVVVVVARVAAQHVADFQRYERAVLSLVGEHGGQLQRRLRSSTGDTEVHLVGFPSAEHFARYRTDPRRAQQRELLAPDAAQFEVFELRDVSLAELLGAAPALLLDAPLD